MVKLRVPDQLNNLNCGFWGITWFASVWGAGMGANLEHDVLSA